MSTIIDRLRAGQITKQDAEPLTWVVFALRLIFRYLPFDQEDRAKGGPICIELPAYLLGVLEHANRVLAENDGLSVAAPE